MYKFFDIMEKNQLLNENPLVLAFVGDAVYSLYVRAGLSFNFDYKTGELNKYAVSKVKATAQAQLVKKLIPYFTEEELGVFKRARNTKKTTKAKSASVVDYNASTGFEAVVGFLYLLGNIDRLNYLLKIGETNEG